MYNVLIKDFATISFNPKRNILTIKFLDKKAKQDKFHKLTEIVNQLVSEKSFILILDFSINSVMLSDFRTLFLERLQNINIISLIIISKNKFQKTLYNILKPFTVLNSTINYQFVQSLDEAIKVTNELKISQ